MAYDHCGASFLADVLVVALLKWTGVHERRITARRQGSQRSGCTCLGATW
jgi:hypothetical protein